MFSVKSALVQWIPLIYLIPTFRLMAVNRKKLTIGYVQLIPFDCLMVNFMYKLLKPLDFKTHFFHFLVRKCKFYFSCGPK